MRPPFSISRIGVTSKGSLIAFTNSYAACSVRKAATTRRSEWPTLSSATTIYSVAVEKRLVTDRLQYALALLRGTLSGRHLVSLQTGSSNMRICCLRLLNLWMTSIMRTLLACMPTRIVRFSSRRGY